MVSQSMSYGKSFQSLYTYGKLKLLYILFSYQTTTSALIWKRYTICAATSGDMDILQKLKSQGKLARKWDKCATFTIITIHIPVVKNKATMRYTLAIHSSNNFVWRIQLPLVYWLYNTRCIKRQEFYNDTLTCNDMVAGCNGAALFTNRRAFSRRPLFLRNFLTHRTNSSKNWS